MPTVTRKLQCNVSPVTGFVRHTIMTVGMLDCPKQNFYIIITGLLPFKEEMVE